jgi:hypothetical protein
MISDIKSKNQEFNEQEIEIYDPNETENNEPKKINILHSYDSLNQDDISKVFTIQDMNKNLVCQPIKVDSKNFNEALTELIEKNAAEFDDLLVFLDKTVQNNTLKKEIQETLAKNYQSTIPEEKFTLEIEGLNKAQYLEVVDILIEMGVDMQDIDTIFEGLINAPDSMHSNITVNTPITNEQDQPRPSIKYSKD